MQVVSEQGNLLSSVNLTSTCLQKVHDVACYCAYGVGVPKQDVADCAAEFTLKICRLYLKEKQGNSNLTISLRWLRRSAKNHAIDFLRHNSSIRIHEVPLLGEDNGEKWLPTMEQTPEQHLLAWECRQQVYAVITCLTPAQQELFIRRAVYGHSITEIAATTGREAHAVRQAYCHLRKRLRDLFALRNISELELRDYIQYIQAGAGGGVELVLLITSKYVIILFGF